MDEIAHFYLNTARNHMGNGLPDDWYIEHSGESRILDQGKVAAEIERLRDDLAASERLRDHATKELGKDSALVERLRAAARDYLLEQTDERAAALAEALNLGNYILESTEVTDALSC